jgi:hypothetical protein
VQFLSRYLKEEMYVTELCREYGIPRSSVDKRIKRPAEPKFKFGAIDRRSHGTRYSPYRVLSSRKELSSDSCLQLKLPAKAFF